MSIELRLHEGFGRARMSNQPKPRTEARWVSLEPSLARVGWGGAGGQHAGSRQAALDDLRQPGKWLEAVIRLSCR